MEQRAQKETLRYMVKKNVHIYGEASFHMSAKTTSSEKSTLFNSFDKTGYSYTREVGPLPYT
jgi:hypothetical protein